MTQQPSISRRSILAAGGAAALAGAYAHAQPAGTPSPIVGTGAPGPGDSHRKGPVVISSFNGLRATVRAMELLGAGYDPADAIVQGVRIIEDDPEDDSVGLGGLPNADGIVELDASVMYGPTHKSGAVGALRNIKNPAQVALYVLRRTDHCLLVGEGALQFARSHGFREENLLTEHARREWMAWRENMSHDDDWLNDDERDEPRGKTWDQLPWESTSKEDTTPRTNDGPNFRDHPHDHPHAGAGATPVRPASPPPPPPASGGPSAPKPYGMDVTGTCHCAAVTAGGDIASCTTTSGLNWKIAGRVGDSPIIGAGNYCDNEIGAAGSTGRGEANIVTLAAARIVDFMGAGLTPTEACLKICKFVADHTKEKRLRGPDGRPNFDLKFYALRKDGAYGAASLYAGTKFSVHDGAEAKIVSMAYLYERAKAP